MVWERHPPVPTWRFQNPGEPAGRHACLPPPWRHFRPPTLATGRSPRRRCTSSPRTGRSWWRCSRYRNESACRCRTLESTCLAWVTLATVAGRSTSAARRSDVPRGIATLTVSDRKDTRSRPARWSPSHPVVSSASCPGPGRTPAGILKRTRPKHGSWVSLRAADKRRRDTIPILRGELRSNDSRVLFSSLRYAYWDTSYWSGSEKVWKLLAILTKISVFNLVNCVNIV